MRLQTVNTVVMIGNYWFDRFYLLNSRSHAGGSGVEGDELGNEATLNCNRFVHMSEVSINIIHGIDS